VSTELRPAIAKHPNQEPITLYGIRPSTFEAILEDVGVRQQGLAYDFESLALESPSQLQGIRWETFQAILDDLGDHRGVRLAYDRGRLQFMSPSPEHEHGRKLLGRMVETLTQECRIPMKSGGSLTLPRSELFKGVEPDESYWLAKEPAVRGRSKLNLAVDPAPDLAIEMDVSHNSLGSLPIYAALGVSEVWRFVDGKLLIYALQADGQYATASESLVLPGLLVADVERFIGLAESLDETTWIWSFQTWVREEYAPRRSR
jgi:Uma2 family endonuclease